MSSLFSEDTEKKSLYTFSKFIGNIIKIYYETYMNRKISA